MRLLSCLSIATFLLGASNSFAVSVYTQGFESDTSNWTDGSTVDGYGGITRVASGTNGVTSQNGGFHAEITSTDTGPFTSFVGYSSVWPGDYSTQIGIYIDPAKLGVGGGFDYTVASNNQSGTHLRDFAFHVANDASTGTVLLNVDNGSLFTPATNLETLPGTVTLNAVGWYTFRQTFLNVGGVLAVQMQVFDPSTNQVFSSTLSQPTDLIATAVGGNRYGWFAALSTAQPLPIDNVTLTTVPEASASLLLLGGVAGAFARRRRC